MDLAETKNEAPEAAKRKAAAKRSDDPMLTPEDIADELFLKPRTVREHMRKKEIPGFKVCGKKWVCRKSIFEKWVIDEHVLIRSKAYVAEEKQQLFGGGRN